MKRREAIEKTSWILKSAIFAPGLVGVIHSCSQKVSDSKDLLVLNVQQNKLVKLIADTMIPKTDTVSASDVNVNGVMDLLLNDAFEKEVSNRFLLGLDQFDKNCLKNTGDSFTELSQTDRHNYLEKIDKEVMEKSYNEQVPFYYTFKQLTITIYFTSEQGIKQNLDYQPVPGQFQNDIALKPGDKIMVGNQM